MSAPKPSDLLLGPGAVLSTTTGTILPIPPHLAPALAPATACLYEWTDYWLDCPAADKLRVGDTVLGPVTPGSTLFRVRFENRLGLAALQPLAAGRPLGPPTVVEVISAKFPTPEAHLTFFRALLDDLFARAARLPFALGAPTGRAVAEALQPPTPLFTLHFLLGHAPALRAAIATLLARPHRRLRDREETVPLAAVADLDADVLLGIVRAPQTWVRADPARLAVAARLRGHAPATVRQRLPEETVDTPENRFALHALRAMLVAAEAIPDQPWWPAVSPARQRTVRAATDLLRRAVADPVFAAVGRMERYPAASRILPPRPGYRDLLALWQTFTHARRPLFRPLQQAIALRDVASLYEVWVFFALVEEIGAILGEHPAIDLRLSDETGLHHGAQVRYSAGTLSYNRPARSYSGISMRPDFTWIASGGDLVALDAKFRLDRTALVPGATALGEARAKHDDLYTMHAYRDGLGMRAAVAVYPGDVPMFYDAARIGRTASLATILLSDATGVGALPLRPDRGLTTPEQT